MAAAFDRAGFDSIDVHMSDLIAGRRDLKAFHGLVARVWWSLPTLLICKR